MNKKVNVIGAGFSGLVLSYYLNRAGFEVHIFESESRVGGLLNSPQTKFGLVEQAANGFIATADLVQLCKTANIKIIKPSQLSKKKYIFFDGKKVRWPFGFLASVRLIFKVLLFKTNKEKYKPEAFESLRAWGTRLFGKKVVDALIEPAFLGVYATEAHDLSATLVTKNLFKDKNKSPQEKIKRETISVTDGMLGFCESLADYLKQQGVVINLQQPVTELNKNEMNFLTCNPSQASQLIDNQTIKDDLNKLKPVTLAKAACFTQELPSDGFGCLFARREKIKSLGVLFDSNLFPGRYSEEKLQTWIVGDQFCEDEKNILSQVKDDMEIFWGEELRISFSDIKIWQETLPKYDAILEDFLLKYDTMQPVIANNYLFANYCGDIGLSQILTKAQKLTERLLK